MAVLVSSTPTTLLGGKALKAAGLVAATTAETAIQMGHGSFTVQAVLTAAEIASNDEVYIAAIEANTLAATTTWTTIGFLFAVGATEVTGGSGDAAGTETFRGAFNNPYDYQIRIKTWVGGAVATGINYSASAYPIASLSY